MRVYLSKRLISWIEGKEDTLPVYGRLDRDIDHAFEESLQKFPAEFLKDSPLLPGFPEIDYLSPVRVIMPNEFQFSVDTENLERLDRERLLRTIPAAAEVWQADYAKIPELWIGGKGEIISPHERGELTLESRRIWDLPFAGASLALGTDIRDLRRIGVEEAIKTRGAKVVDSSANCAFFVTDDPRQAAAARRSGAGRILNVREFFVWLEAP